MRPSLRVSAAGLKLRLAWRGVPPGKAVIYRNGRRLQGAISGNHWTDRDVVAGGRYRYRVCTGGKLCSHSVAAQLNR